MRKKAIQFARKYISKHPNEKDQLRIILEEEAKETLHAGPKDFKKGNYRSEKSAVQANILLLFFTILAAVFIIMATISESAPERYITITISITLAFLIIVTIIVRKRDLFKKKKR